MATGLIGTLAANSSLSYAPALSSATLFVNAVGGPVSLNGVAAVQAGTQGSFRVGIGQTVTISTGDGTTAVVSSLEG